MGAKGSARDSAAVMLYDVLEPYKIGSGVLKSVFADPEDAWLVLNTSENHSLNFRAEADDDTIWLMDGPRSEVGVNVSSHAIWREFIGQEIFFGWLAVNQNGYIDSALLGFQEAVPSVCISVVASAMKVSKVGIWQRASAE